MNVREAIVSDPRVVQAAASGREAAELLTHPHVLSVLVVDGERLVGCVTPDSIVARVAEGVDIGRLTAAELAEPNVTSVGPDEQVDQVLHMMSDHDLERIAVVEDGRFLGILPREPLLRRLAEEESGDDVSQTDGSAPSGA